VVCLERTAVGTEPYTSSVEMCTTRSMPSRRAACMTMLVPTQLVMAKSSGPEIDRSTWLSAAKCTTASWRPELPRGLPGRRCRRARSGTGPRALLHVRQRGQVPGVGQSIVDGDFVVAVGERPAHVVGPYEPCPPVMKSFTAREASWAPPERAHPPVRRGRRARQEKSTGPSGEVD